MKHILTKYESIRRTEKVDYEIQIPDKIKNKMAYAEKQITDNNYAKYKVIDIVDSELLDEKVIGLRSVKRE